MAIRVIIPRRAQDKPAWRSVVVSIPLQAADPKTRVAFAVQEGGLRHLVRKWVHEIAGTCNISRKQTRVRCHAALGGYFGYVAVYRGAPTKKQSALFRKVKKVAETVSQKTEYVLLSKEEHRTGLIAALPYVL